MLLEGLKVVEMATWVAGPACATVMADWGADVIKVESPMGDATRAFALDTEESPGNPIFTNENRGKRGVILDITKPAGRAALIELIKQADIFVTNTRYKSLRKFGLDYDTLKELNPRKLFRLIMTA